MSSGLIASPLPTPENFMNTLDPIYRGVPTYRSLDEHLRGELRVLLAEETRRWIKKRRAGWPHGQGPLGDRPPL